MKIGCYNSPFNSSHSPPSSPDPATRGTNLSYKLLISLKQSSIIMKTQATEFQKVDRLVYPIWEQWVHICLWVWCPLNSGVLRLNLQSPISIVHAPLQVSDCRWVTEPGDFKHHSWDRYPLRELHNPALADLGKETLKCVSNYWVLCNIFTGALLQNCKGRAWKFFSSIKI